MLVDLLSAPPDIVHQDVLTEAHRSGEIGLSLTDLRYLLHEVNKIIIIGQHEGVDHNRASAAQRDFAKGLFENTRVQPHRILVNPAVRQGHRRRLAVSDHYYLAHIFSLS